MISVKMHITHTKSISNIKRIIIAIIFILLMASSVMGVESGDKNRNKTKEKPVIKSETVKKAASETEKKMTDIIAAKKTDKKPDKKTAKKKDKESKADKMEKKIKWIQETLDFGIQKDRKNAINRMLSIEKGPYRDRIIKRLDKLIKEEIDQEIIIKALSVAGELNAETLVDSISLKLHDETEDVKVAAVFALKRLKAVSQKKKLITELKKQDLENNSNYTQALIDTLGYMKAGELVKYASDGIDDNKTAKGLRQTLVLFLGNAGSKDARDFLVKLYKDDEEEILIRSYAVNSIGKLGLKETTEDIHEVVKRIDSYPFKKKKNYYNLYIYSISALVKLGDTKAVPKLMNSLRSDNDSVRLKAVMLLKELKDKRTIDILKYKMKYDSNSKVRKAAEEALKEMGVDTEKLKPDYKKKKTEKNKKTKKAKEIKEKEEQKSNDRKPDKRKTKNKKQN